jgi:pimeloyl-ACP methyl ester carboxylesterase
VNPLYFGDSARPLFGMYHPPAGRAAAVRNVVLCPSLGQEYIRAHRALRQLATQLARAGHHVLRFDYDGQGDSAGEAWEPTLDTWVTNTGTAALELRDTSGVADVVLVGIRLGAVVAARAAASVQPVDLVLWDPAIAGRRYLDELCATFRVPPAALAASGRGETIGVGGMPITLAFRSQLEAIDLLAEPVPRVPRALVITSRPDPDAERLAARYRAAGTPAAQRTVEISGSWEGADRAGAILLPQQVIRAIAEHVDGREAS